MNRLTQDYIVIDTNVFRHLFNPQDNHDGHIDRLLNALQGDNIKLIVDADGIIEEEHRKHLQHRLERGDILEKHRRMLVYWLNIAKIADRIKKVPICKSSKLMQAIICIVVPNKKDEYMEADRLFVYVALSEGKVLVTNDKKHILRSGTKKGPYTRRDQLLCDTMKFRPPSANILDSREAHSQI